jgi:hypothetical protein
MPFPKSVRLLGVSLSSLQTLVNDDVEPQLDPHLALPMDAACGSVAETAPKALPDWTCGGAAYPTSRSWMIGFRPSGAISRRASVIGSLKRRRPALPGFR